jgi:hypothetical protein
MHRPESAQLQDVFRQVGSVDLSVLKGAACTPS